MFGSSKRRFFRLCATAMAVSMLTEPPDWPVSWQFRLPRGLKLGSHHEIPDIKILFHQFGSKCSTKPTANKKTWRPYSNPQHLRKCQAFLLYPPCWGPQMVCKATAPSTEHKITPNGLTVNPMKHILGGWEVGTFVTWCFIQIVFRICCSEKVSNYVIIYNIL